MKWAAAVACGLAALASGPCAAEVSTPLARLVLDYNTPTDPNLQDAVARIDTRLRDALGMAATQTAVGVFDLRRGRLALLRPDAIEYAASIPKIAILYAWFKLTPDPLAHLDAERREEFGRMIKQSDNAIAAKYSEQLGLKRIQAVLDADGFYDAAHGGGLWVGKHYSKGGERYVDPVGGHSHAATVRQLLRYYLLLEQGRLISADVSRAVRMIFASPQIPHVADKFVLGLQGRPVEILRKAGWWETWAHDSAVVSGPDRHYLIVALTHHPQGDEYLQRFAAAVDDLLLAEPSAAAGR